jgi:hypothetical protein
MKKEVDPGRLGFFTIADIIRVLKGYEENESGEETLLKACDELDDKGEGCLTAKDLK